MKYLHRLLAVASAAFFIVLPASAQNAGTVTANAFAIGKGAGTTGYASLLCTSAQLAVGQSAAAPICQTISGDVTINASGVTAIGTAKVTSAMLRNSGALSVIGRSANSSGVPGDISCTAASDAVLRESGSVLGCGQIATNGIANNAVTLAKLATQGANTVLANATAGAAVPTAFAMPSCSTSASALNWTTSTGFGCNTAISVAVANVTGLGTGVGTALAINTGSAGAVVIFNGSGGTPSSITLTNGTGLPTTGLTGTLQAAQEPAHTGDVTNTAGSLALAIAANAVTNAKTATMNAFTLKGNNTSGAATPTDVDISLLTAKASPASTDLVMISDQAASGAWKRVTVSSLASAGSVASYNTRTGAVTAVSTDVPIQSYLTGLTLSTAGASSTFGIAVGVATDTTNVLMMSLGSAYTKTTSAWALGTAAGALDTGAIANSTWYHVYLIARSDTGVVDVLFSLSASSPTMPTSYDRKRRIGSIKTNGSAQWVKFVQVDDRFLWDVSVLDVNDSAQGTTAILRTISVPLGVQTLALTRASISNAAAGNTCLFSSPDESDQASGGGVYDLLVPANSVAIGGRLDIRTNTSSQVRTRASAASTTVVITTYGWVDTRGKFN